MELPLLTPKNILSKKGYIPADDNNDKIKETIISKMSNSFIILLQEQDDLYKNYKKYDKNYDKYDFPIFYYLGMLGILISILFYIFFF